MSAQRYPLAWPVGWRRTKYRGRARFSTITTRTGVGYTLRDRKALTVYQAVERLMVELDRLGVTNPILSTNVEPRLDGAPRSDRAEPADPGVAVYFQLIGNPQCFACDKWDRVADNIAAIASHSEAVREAEGERIGTAEAAVAGSS